MFLIWPFQKPHPPAVHIFCLHVAANQKKVFLKIMERELNGLFHTVELSGVTEAEWRTK